MRSIYILTLYKIQIQKDHQQDKKKILVDKRLVNLYMYYTYIIIMIVLYQLAELYLSHYIQYKNQLGVFSIFFLFGLLLITHICSKPKKLNIHFSNNM